jgi:hypothetical protein
MSDRLEVLALERKLLVARAQLCRLKLRSGSRSLRDSLSWRRAAVSVAAIPAAGRLAFDLAISLLGARNAARTIAIASRALSFARIVRALAGYSRIPAAPPRLR